MCAIRGRQTAKVSRDIFDDPSVEKVIVKSGCIEPVRSIEAIFFCYQIAISDDFIVLGKQTRCLDT